MKNNYIVDKLYEDNASLVVQYADGKCEEYFSQRIIDIVNILKENKDALRGAEVADKVIGKVAASIFVMAGVMTIYADTLSKIALPILEENGIEYSYNNLVEYIQNSDKTGMCPMENRFKDENNLKNIYEYFVK